MAYPEGDFWNAWASKQDDIMALRFMGDEPLESWADFEGSPSYYAWRGNAFEIVCLSHIPQIKSAIGMSAVRTECFPWSSTTSTPGAQVDLVIERKDGVTDLCEMKLTDSPLSPSHNLLAELHRKRAVFREESSTKNAVHLVLVGTVGASTGVRFEDVSAVVGIDDLFLP